MTKSIKIGVIGCGKQAYKHIPALRKLGCEVVVADVSEEMACNMAGEFKVERAKDPAELLVDTDVKAVTICTPTDTHQPIILDALAAGKHFFCEKPLAGTFQEAEIIQRKLKETNLIGMVGYLYRFHPAFEMVHEIIQEGTIGDPYFATFRLGGRGGHREWKHLKEKGGGAINEMMVHMLDLALWYFGNVTQSRTIMMDTVLKERVIDGKTITADAEDLVVVKLDTETGVRVVCESDLITPSYMNYIEIQGTNGSLITSILDYFPSFVYCKEPRGSYQTGNNILKFPRVNLFDSQLKYFIECITTSRQPRRNTVKDSVDILKLLEVVRRSGEGRIQ